MAMTDVELGKREFGSGEGRDSMFERYTERARRVIFFARYEASQVGSPVIGDEHLLTGLMREDKGLLRQYIGGEPSAEAIRAAITAATLIREPTSTSVDLPLSPAAKRILAYAAEEAERLAHQHIGTEHLLLGILRQESCLSARLLRERGLTIQGARVQIAEAVQESAAHVRVVSQGIGSGAARRSPGTPVRLVEVGSSEPLLVYHGSSSVPLIGEEIRIREDGQAERRYRVKDVVWNFDRSDNASRLADVEVRIAAEDFNGTDR
jgi:hypothetical protein